MVGMQFHRVENQFHVPPNASVSRPRFWRFPYWNKHVYSLNSRHVFMDYFILRTVTYFDGYRNKLRSFDDETYSSQERGYAFDSYYDDYSYGIMAYPQLE